MASTIFTGLGAVHLFRARQKHRFLVVPTQGVHPPPSPSPRETLKVKSSPLRGGRRPEPGARPSPRAMRAQTLEDWPPLMAPTITTRADLNNPLPLRGPASADQNDCWYKWLYKKRYKDCWLALSQLPDWAPSGHPRT